MVRYSSSDILQVGTVHEGTSAAFVGLNTKTGRKGIYKENGALLGITNEDIREKLASDILKTIGVNCADIDLVYDENLGQNACFSNYIISDDEQLVSPPEYGPAPISDDRVEDFFKKYIDGVKKLTDDPTVHAQCRKNYFSYVYACCVLDSYDIKPDNLPLVLNTKTGKYSISSWFDFGTAFKEDSDKRQGFFWEMSAEEVMKLLAQKHYEDIKDIAGKVNANLTPEKINEIFNSDYILEALDENEIENIRARLVSQVEKSREMAISREKDSKANPKWIKTFFANVKNRVFSLLNKGKNVKLLDGQSAPSYEDKEKLAEFGDSSVAAMNDDDPSAEKMYEWLYGNTYPPEQVVTYDNNYAETKNIGEQDITIEGQ